MKITIIGAGGVGGYFGARLARAGFDVTFVARGEHLRAIQRDGLFVKSIDGDFSTGPVRATGRITGLDAPDLVIVCVKAWQISEIRDDLAKIIHPGSIILPLQNGISAADELAVATGRSHVLGGLCRIISRIESPGVINHFGIEPFIAFGETDRSHTERLTAVKEVFDRAGISCRISGDITADLWKKFIAICVSGLLAVARANYGEIRSIPETRKMMISLLQEIHDLAAAIGVHIGDDCVAKTVAFIDTYPPGSTSSLTRDVWDGRPSEIEYQNGTVVKLAREYGVEVPVNRFVYHCILPMERRAKKNVTRDR